MRRSKKFKSAKF